MSVESGMRDGLRSIPLVAGRLSPHECARAVLSQLPWSTADIPDLRTANVLDHAASEAFGCLVRWDGELRLWTMSPEATREGLASAAEAIGDLLSVCEVMEA